MYPMFMYPVRVKDPSPKYEYMSSRSCMVQHGRPCRHSQTFDGIAPNHIQAARHVNHIVIRQVAVGEIAETVDAPVGQHMHHKLRR